MLGGLRRRQARPCQPGHGLRPDLGRALLQPCNRRVQRRPLQQSSHSTEHQGLDGAVGRPSIALAAASWPSTGDRHQVKPTVGIGEIVPDSLVGLFQCIETDRHCDGIFPQLEALRDRLLGGRDTKVPVAARIVMVQQAECRWPELRLSGHRQAATDAPRSTRDAAAKQRDMEGRRRVRRGGLRNCGIETRELRHDNCHHPVLSSAARA